MIMNIVDKINIFVIIVYLKNSDNITVRSHIVIKTSQQLYETWTYIYRQTDIHRLAQSDDIDPKCALAHGE